MCVAMIYPEPEERGRGKKSSLNVDFSATYIKQARTVLRDAPDLVDSVLSGAKSP